MRDDFLIESHTCTELTIRIGGKDHPVTSELLTIIDKQAREYAVASQEEYDDRHCRGKLEVIKNWKIGNSNLDLRSGEPKYIGNGQGRLRHPHPVWMQEYFERATDGYSAKRYLDYEIRRETKRHDERRPFPYAKGFKDYHNYKPREDKYFLLISDKKILISLTWMRSKNTNFIPWDQINDEDQMRSRDRKGELRPYWSWAEIQGEQIFHWRTFEKNPRWKYIEKWAWHLCRFWKRTLGEYLGIYGQIDEESGGARTRCDDIESLMWELIWRGKRRDYRGLREAIQSWIHRKIKNRKKYGLIREERDVAFLVPNTHQDGHQGRSDIQYADCNDDLDNPDFVQDQWTDGKGET